ncbi:Uncharacterized membrane protein YhgE [Fructobacillus tropaeoli]|nr:Uncharacterized membrane protein YhgE [Fructobacillus tropaeoli]
MYKSGKQWLVAGMATFALVGATQVITGHALIDFGQNITAHAADSSTNYWMGQNTDYFKRYADLPNASTVPLSTQQTWGYAKGEIATLQNPSTGTTFKFDSLKYDSSTGLYTLTVKLNVPVLTTGGSGRTSYLDFGLSDSLAAKTTGTPTLIAANGNPGTLNHNPDGTYSNSFSAGGYVGGTSTISIQINPVKIQQSDEISAMYSSDTPTTGYHAIFSSVRTMGYNDFGLQFNQALLTQMKQNSTDAINNSKLSTKQKAAEQAKVNAVTTDDDFVNKLQAIDKDVAAKSAANAVPIDQQRATALQQYKDAHNVDKILNEIANDSTLTQAQKDAQSKQVNDAVAVIKGNLDKATDSDDVATAIADTSQDNAIATAYQPGTSLATQIKNAQDAIDAQAAKSKALVDNNTTLTDAQKSAQKSAIDTVATTAKNNIGAKTSADDINTAQAAGIKNLTDLDTAKPAAYTTLTTKANSAISTINNDQNLTDADKATRIAQVNDALKKITDQIDQATDATTVNNLAGSTDLDNAIATATSDNGVTPVATQRDNANKQIDQVAAETKAKISEDKNLTTQEKANQTANVDKAVSDAKAAIENGSAQVIADTVSKAQGTIAGSYVAGNPLPDRQKDAEKALQTAADAAKSNLDAQVAQANNDINNNNYLTDAQKAAQKQAIQDAANAAIDKINAAQNADDVNTALDSGQNVVNNLNAQKLAARTAVNTAVQNAEAAVNNNNALTADQKKDRIAQIEAAKTTAGNTIDSATDASVISGVPASGSTFDQAIKAATDFSNVTSLDGQKDAAKAALDSAGQAAKDALDAAKTAQENAIDQDGNLTPEQKTAQKAAIDQAVTNAKSDISNATNADDVTKAKDAAVTAISNLSGEKTAARQALAKQAQAAIDTINGNNALTAADKASRIKQVQDAYNTATSAVDAATTADGVTTAQNSADFANAIKEATNFSNVTALSDQKAAADKAVDDAATAVKAKIDTDPNLSDADKTAQKSTVDSVATAKKGVIDSATKADDVATAKDAGIQAVNNLDKTDGNASLTKQANDAKSAINSNAALTQAAKDAFNKQIDAAKSTAQNTVNNATDPTAVQQATSSDGDYAKALANILSQASQTPSVQTQQATAEKAIDDANTAAKAKVDADKNLSDADKAAQKAALDTVANQAKTAIQQATTADAINQAQANGTNALSNMDKTADDESAAKQAADAHTAINNNSALTQAQKDAFNKQIDDAKNAAQDIVNKATDPTTASAAVDTQNSDYAKQLAAIAKQASAVPSLDSQKETADQAIDNAANTVKSGIDADKNLSDADKAAQKAVVDSQVTAAKQAIANANNADDVNTAQAQGVKTINDLANAKTSADETITSAVKAAHDAINNNPALSTAEKASRNAAIDTAASKVQGVVNQATTPDAVNAAIADSSDFKTALSGATDTSSVKTIAQQQADAEKAIDDANTAAKAKVDADPSISDADKAAQKATLDGLANAAKQNIQNAQTADDITNAQNAGVKSLNDLDKTTVNANLKKQVADAHASVNTNPVLSQAEKDARNQAIDAAAKTAQDTVNAAKTIDAANAVIASGSDLDNALKSSTDTSGVKTIAQQQADAEKAIDDANTAAKAKVDADPSISDVDKAAQKATLDGLANTAKQNIQNAQTADDITNAQNAGVKSLNDLDKTTADKQLSDKVAQAHATVNGNNDLSQAEKDARNQAIDAAAKTAQDAINKATTLDDVTKALANGADFDNAVSKATSTTGVTPLADQKTAAAKAIDDAVTAAKSKIDADPSISDADKQAQKAVIDDLANKAKTNINAATNADGVTAAKTAGVNSIANLDKTPVDADLVKQIQAAHAAVNGNPALSSAEKQARNQAIDTAAKAAQDAVNAATTIDDANAVIASGSALDNALKSATSNDGVKTVAEQQAAAVQAINDALAKVEAQIDADKTLTDADKQAQKAVAGKQAADAIANINKATNADDIATAQKAGIDALNKLEDAKTTTDASLADKVKAAEEAINSNKALTSDQKTDRLNALHEAQAAAQDAINKATDPDAVAQVIADGSDFAKAVATATSNDGVKTIADQQSDADKAIDDAAAKAKQAIDADKTLTDADKQAQKDVIDGQANMFKQAINSADNADDINKDTATGVKALQDLTDAKTEADAKLATDVQNAHDAVNNNKALTTAQKAERNQAIDEAQKNAQDAINQATTPSSAKNAGLNIADGLAKATATDGVPSVADQQKAAITAIQQAADKAKQAIDADKTLTDAQKADQKAAIDAIVKSATDAVNQATDADSINKIQADTTDALNNIHGQKADALSKLQKQADDANHAIDANNALTTEQKQAAHEAVAKALTNAQAVTDQATTADDVAKSGNQAVYNKALQDIADGLAKVPSLADQAKAAIEKLTEAVNKAKDALTGPDADAQKKALDKVLSDGTAKLNAQTNADDLNKTLADVLNTVNGLNQAKADALTDLDAQAKKATDTINADPSFTDDEKATRVAAVAKALQDAHDAVNEATDLPGVDAARKAAAFPEALNNATSDAGVQTLADRKTDAKKAHQNAADKAKSAIDADKTLTDAQKTAQKQAIDQALKTAQDQIDAATTATKVDVSKATNLPTFDTLNKAKTDAHQAEDKAYNDAKATIQNNNDLTDAEKQARISDLDKAHQAASDAIDKAVTPDEIKTAAETAAFDNAVKQATDFSKVTPLPERKQISAVTINNSLQKAVDEVNANTKLDVDAKARQIAILKQEAQDAVTKLNGQTNAQGVVDFVPTVVPTFEKLNQSKVDARARLQNNAATTKAAIDADDNLSNAQKQAQKDAVDAALKQAVIDVDNGQDVPTVNGIPDGSTAVKEINQGHVTATKTPTQQEEDLNAQIDDQAAKVKADIDADVTLKAAEKAAQKHTIDSFVAETKAKIAGLTKYQDRLDVVNQALDSLKNLHQQGKPLAEQKSDAIAAIDQKAAQIRTQIANDSRLTQAQKELDYQLVADAVAKAKAQVNAALNADEIAAGLDYGTVQLEAAYQQKVQEQYAEKQPTTPTIVKTAPVLPQTGETEKNHEGALVAEALVASVAGFFLSKVNKRRQDEK